jgi:UDP-galactopyranose mutase
LDRDLLKFMRLNDWNMVRDPSSDVSSETAGGRIDLLCFSHLRWDFVFQRPQHLMTRAAARGRVFFIEEHVATDGVPSLDVSEREGGVTVVVPRLPDDTADINAALTTLIDGLVEQQVISRFIKWYYTPQMLEWSRHLKAEVTVYDCMDELSAFKNAPPELRESEAELFAEAEIVFTGGRTLYNAKRSAHDNVHLFPSSIDVAHFSRALSIQDDRDDQASIAQPRAGYVGVIDERFDAVLLGELADLKPDWNFIMIGPVVKIDPEDLPQRENIHYLGGRTYEELPGYLAGWQVAIMPFAINEATRYISPTKTPEFLAAGLPVVSTPISDVVEPYGRERLVHIGATSEEFSDALERAAAADLGEHRFRSAKFLSQMSWDDTFDRMSILIDEAISQDQKARAFAQ